MSGRRYGPDDTRTRTQRREDAAHRVVAILAAVEQDDVEDRAPDDPNSIALAASRRHGMPLRRPTGHSGKVLGPGSAIAGVFTSMHTRGLLTRVRRRDGLSGGGYRITAAGRKHLAEHRALLDAPWHDTPGDRP